MLKVRIEVIKVLFDSALAEHYLTDGATVGPCPLLREGQVFIFEGGARMPEGFCPWAWHDVYRSVSVLHAGGSFEPWNNRAGQTVVCCTDGIRPVVFELTALEA